MPKCETVTAPHSPVAPDCRDPFDCPFLELALAAGADAPIAADKDLLGLESPFSIPIVTPATFRDRFAGDAG